MDAPPPAPAPRSWPLVTLAVVALGLLVYRGYGPRFATRPIDDAPPVAAVDLNTADRTELLQLPGVGPATADAILAYRHDRGRFGTIDELDAVKGVGPKTLTKLREHVRVGPTARGQAPPDPPVERLERKPQTSPLPGKVTEGDRPISVNTATVEELQRLPGIGPKLAERIAAERGRKPFASVEDMRRVSGIGPKTVEKLRPLVRFD